MLILRDPTPAEGGGTAQTPTATPSPTPTGTTPQTVPVPIAELQSLLSLPARLAEFEARQRQAEKDAQEKLTQAQLKQGQAEEAVNTVRTNLEKERDVERQARVQTETTAKNYARTTELTSALASHGKVRPAAIPQLVRLLENDVEVIAENGQFQVRTPATHKSPYKAAKDYVAEVLASPDYAHFLLPSNPGGSGASGANLTTATPTGTEGQKTFEQAVYEQWRAANTVSPETPSWMIPVQNQTVRRN